MALEGVLKRMDSGLLTSIEPECNGAEGVYFWSGAFTKDQIDLITNTYKALVAGVEPNGPVYETTFQRVIKTPHTQPDEPNGLNFISTAPGTTDPGQYAYILQDKWPARITVFEFGSGFDLARAEFAGTDKAWIYTLGTTEKPELDDENAHGTCMASLVMGRLYGVARNLPSLIAVKVRLEDDSILDGWKQIINVLTGWRKRGRQFAGYTVIHAALSSQPAGFLHETKYRSLIEILVRDFQAVIVCSAGQNRMGHSAMDSPDGNVYYLPAIFSLDYDTITVGAVDIRPGNDFGIQYRNTHGGPTVTVFAPVSGRCSMEYSINPLGWEDVEGTSPASAYTAGLAAYFLGLPDLGPYLRSFHPNIPKAVKEYIQSKAYSRNPAGTFPAIWNGLDAHDQNDEWTYWAGNPNVDSRPAQP